MAGATPVALRSPRPRGCSRRNPPGRQRSRRPLATGRGATCFGGSVASCECSLGRDLVHTKPVTLTGPFVTVTVQLQKITLLGHPGVPRRGVGFLFYSV